MDDEAECIKVVANMLEAKDRAAAQAAFLRSSQFEVKIFVLKFLEEAKCSQEIINSVKEEFGVNFFDWHEFEKFLEIDNCVGAANYFLHHLGSIHVNPESEESCTILMWLYEREFLYLLNACLFVEAQNLLEENILGVATSEAYGQLKDLLSPQNMDKLNKDCSTFADSLDISVRGSKDEDEWMNKVELERRDRAREKTKKERAEFIKGLKNLVYAHPSLSDAISPPAGKSNLPVPVDYEALLSKIENYELTLMEETR